ncbi:MAG TPA: histidinol-phosphatase HisJ family protein, partial [Arcobacter sp.]|nr:histidinol-phosphatase HisJ family protein [Arcobacter sp.]
HATGTMEEYIKKAIELQIDTFGFSEHAPMNNFEDGYRLTLDKKAYYEKSVKNLQEKYQDQINILLGYEVDYIDNNYLLYEIIDADVDYLIGSVHYLNDWGFDNPEFISEYKKRDINDIWRDYFQAVNNMVKSGKFDIVGHFDLIKIFNYLPTVEIKSIVLETLRSIKKNNMVLEINSAGLRKPVNEQYPSKDILELAYELDIPITFSSDAHSVDQVGLNYKRCVEIVKSVGYKNCISFNKRDKIVVNF